MDISDHCDILTFDLDECSQVVKNHSCACRSIFGVYLLCGHSVLESGERNANIPSGILNTYSLQRSWHKCMQVETGNLFKHCIMFSSFWMTLACQTQHKRIFIPRGNTGGATENRQRCGCPYDINHDNHYNNLNATSLKLRSLDVRARFNNFSPDL